MKIYCEIASVLVFVSMETPMRGSREKEKAFKLDNFVDAE